MVINPKKTNVVAAKGIWQVETEVSVSGKPDTPSVETRPSGLLTPVITRGKD